MKTEKKHRVVFLDRDGTICEEVGYMNSPEQMRLIPRSGEAVRRLNRLGFKVVVITNQAGVAKGYFPESVLEKLHEEMVRQLRREDARLDGIYYCPHHPLDGIPPYLRHCECRKPATGLLRKAAAELDLDLSSAYMIGDHFSDVECGQRIGAKTVLLLTGHGQETMARRDEWPRPPSHIAADLFQAVQWLTGMEEQK